MDSIEIILNKDSEGNEINLHNMSLESSKAVRQILDALISLAEYEADLNLKIGMKQGSAANQLFGVHSELEVVYKKIEDAANSSPERENHYVTQLNLIRNSIEHNSDFDIIYSNQNKLRSIKPLFATRFRKTRLKPVIDNEFKIEFIEGHLELNGGRKPNFHLVHNNISTTIECTQAEAQKVNTFLYQNIKISAWTKKRANRLEYNFCDIYAGKSEVYFYEFDKFLKDLSTKKGTEPFHFISEFLEDLYNRKDYTGAKKFIRLFLTPYSLPIHLRTILVMSKAFKDDDVLGPSLYDVQHLLSVKTRKEVY
jgi:hypothetical protein